MHSLAWCEPCAREQGQHWPWGRPRYGWSRPALAMGMSTGAPREREAAEPLEPRERTRVRAEVGRVRHQRAGPRESAVLQGEPTVGTEGPIMRVVGVCPAREKQVRATEDQQVARHMVV